MNSTNVTFRRLRTPMREIKWISFIIESTFGCGTVVKNPDDTTGACVLASIVYILNTSLIANLLILALKICFHVVTVMNFRNNPGRVMNPEHFAKVLQVGSQI